VLLVAGLSTVTKPSCHCAGVVSTMASSNAGLVQNHSWRQGCNNESVQTLWTSFTWCPRRRGEPRVRPPCRRGTAVRALPALWANTMKCCGGNVYGVRPSSDIEHSSGDIEHSSGDIAHSPSDIEHSFGNITHSFGDITHSFGDITHSLQ
jgi:hypothetical protein